MYLRTRRFVHGSLTVARGNAPATVDRGTDAVIMSLIVINIAAVILSTVDSLATNYAGAFRAIEVVSVAVFAAEYALRLWSCTENPDYSSPILGQIRYALRPFLIIDFLAILPFFSECSSSTSDSSARSVCSASSGC